MGLKVELFGCGVFPLTAPSGSETENDADQDRERTAGNRQYDHDFTSIVTVGLAGTWLRVKLNGCGVFPLTAPSGSETEDDADQDRERSAGNRQYDHDFTSFLWLKLRDDRPAKSFRFAAVDEDLLVHDFISPFCG